MTSGVSTSLLDGSGSLLVPRTNDQRVKWSPSMDRGRCADFLANYSGTISLRSLEALYYDQTVNLMPAIGSGPVVPPPSAPAQSSIVPRGDPLFIIGHARRTIGGAVLSLGMTHFLPLFRQQTGQVAAVGGTLLSRGHVRQTISAKALLRSWGSQDAGPRPIYRRGRSPGSVRR